MIDFSFLKNWLDDGRRPVVLECQVSRSGMSMSVYDREKLLYRVPSPACGGGIQKALEVFLASLFQPDLMTLIGAATRLVPVGHQWEGRFVFERYCDLDATLWAADAIGLTVQVHETRSATLLIIQKKGS